MADINDKKICSYLSFKIGCELYAVNAVYVINILEMTKITKVPNAPKYMLGIINLRGIVLPLVDLRTKFGLSSTEIKSYFCILVLEMFINNENILIGMVVDSVEEVIEIKEDEFQPTPNLGNICISEFIDGIYKLNNEDFLMNLNMSRVFSIDEINNFVESANAKKKELETIN